MSFATIVNGPQRTTTLLPAEAAGYVQSHNIIQGYYHGRELWVIHWAWYKRLQFLPARGVCEPPPLDHWMFALYDGDGTFVRAYTEAILEYSYVDVPGYENQAPMNEHYATSNLSYDARCDIVRDCALFHEKCRDLFYEMDDRQLRLAGRDFWLTRNGHGAGFWDGSWQEKFDEEHTWGELLSAACKSFRSCDAYIGDDGLIYVHG